MKCVLNADIFVLDMEDFRDMSANIERTTGSINQIAKSKFHIGNLQR